MDLFYRSLCNCGVLIMAKGENYKKKFIAEMMNRDVGTYELRNILDALDAVEVLVDSGKLTEDAPTNEELVRPWVIS